MNKNVSLETKVVHFGLKTYTDADVLSLIISTGTKEKSALEWSFPNV